MKKFISFVLALCLALSCSIVGLADSETPESQLEIIDTGERVLTINEAAEVLIDKAGYSKSQAAEFYNEYSVSRGYVHVVERWIKYDAGMGYIIEVGCIVEQECGSGHCNYGDVLETWSEASGSGDYTWNPFYARAEVGPPFDTSITFTSRGTLEVAVGASVTAGFEAAGFSLAGELSGTYYMRKTVSIEDTFELGDWLE